MATPDNKTSAVWLIHFRDRRPPHTIQCQLERQLMELFEPVHGLPQLTLRAALNMGGVAYVFHLVFEAAFLHTNGYSLRIEAAWADRPADQYANLRQAAQSWCQFWMGSLQPEVPTSPGQGCSARYRQLAEQALSVEAHLTTVPALQQEILRALRHGAVYSTAHKEGGSTISFRDGQFVRTDYGDWNTVQHFHDDAEFLAFLRQFYDAETSRNIAPNKVSEYQAWKLMLRSLNPNGSGSASAPSSGPMAVLTGSGKVPERQYVPAGVASSLQAYFASGVRRALTGGGIGAAFFVVIRVGFALHDQEPPAEVFYFYYPAFAIFVAALALPLVWFFPRLRPAIATAVARRRMHREYNARQRQNERIDYEENSSLLATCVHLQAMERAMRTAGVEMHRFAGANVEARCVVDKAVWQSHYPDAYPVEYVESLWYERATPTQEAALRCTACQSQIQVRHPTSAGNEPWFPDAPVGKP